MTTTITKTDVIDAAAALGQESWLAELAPEGPQRTRAALKYWPREVRARARRLSEERARERRVAAGLAMNVGAVRRREIVWGRRPPDRPSDAIDVGAGRWAAIEGLPWVEKFAGERIAELVASTTRLASLTVRKARPEELAEDENARFQPSAARSRVWAEILMREDLVRTADHELTHLAGFITALEHYRGDLRRVVGATSWPGRRAFDERVAQRMERDPIVRSYREGYRRAVAAELASAKAAQQHDRELRRRYAGARR